MISDQTILRDGAARCVNSRRPRCGCAANVGRRRADDREPRGFLGGAAGSGDRSKGADRGGRRPFPDRVDHRHHSSMVDPVFDGRSGD